MGPPQGPPPFSGPPPGHHSAPPPQFGGMNLANVWVETKNEEGKLYYYNAQSRETTWTQPEGEGVRILTQQEVRRRGLGDGPGRCITSRRMDQRFGDWGGRDTRLCS